MGSAAAVNATAHDIEVLAKTIYGEARGEPYLGKLAVAYVILNRAGYVATKPRNEFGDGTIAGACLHPKQFSCWNADDLNRPLLDQVTLDDHVYQVCMFAALDAHLAMTADPTKGSFFYWSAKIPTPVWARGRTFVSLGNQHYLQGMA